jgi:hypothetical protein
MPYNLYLSLPICPTISAPSQRVDRGAMIYLYQNNTTLGSRLLAPYIEEIERLLDNIDNTLFVAIARLLFRLSTDTYHQLDAHNNLHIRIETISCGTCIYDSSVLGIPSKNKTLSLGSTEKSFTSFILTHSALWKKYVYEFDYPPDYMYRKYLHLGSKAVNFDAYVEYPGSLLWHALYSDSLPQTLDSNVYHDIEQCQDTPF